MQMLQNGTLKNTKRLLQHQLNNIRLVNKAIQRSHNYNKIYITLQHEI